MSEVTKGLASTVNRCIMQPKYWNLFHLAIPVHMKVVQILMDHGEQNTKTCGSCPEKWNHRLGDFTEIAVISAILGRINALTSRCICGSHIYLRTFCVRNICSKTSVFKTNGIGLMFKDRRSNFEEWGEFKDDVGI